MLEQYGAKGVKLPDVFIRVLLYADDGALITTSASDLQCMLDILRIYCSQWKMVVTAKCHKLTKTIFTRLKG